MIIADVIVRFAVFWIKVALSCLFVLFLQVEIGQKSLEQWLEQALKHSSFGRYLQESVVQGSRVVNEKVPFLTGLANNKVVKRNAIVEFHSSLLKNLDQSIQQFDGNGSSKPQAVFENLRVPSGLPDASPSAFPHLQKKLPKPIENLSVLPGNN